MKTVLTVNTATKRQGFYGKTFTHFREGLVEVAYSLARGLVGNYSTGDVVILWGCVSSGTTSGASTAWAVTAGAIFYNDEVYLVPASNGVFTGANVLVGNVVTAYASGDPVPLDDLSLVNQHQIKTIVLNQGTSGSGIGNYTAFRHVLSVVATQITDNSPGTITSGGTYTLLTAFGFTTPNDGIARRYKVTFKLSCNGNATANINMRLFNTTNSTSYDISSFQSSSNPTQGTIYCTFIAVIGPNETIQAQIQWIAGSTVLANGKLFYEERR